jgi:hypothetical protein
MILNNNKNDEIQINSIKNLRKLDNSNLKQQLKSSTCLNPTIEELFHNLALNYDDSARELDELERKLREYVQKQKLILQEISIDSLLVLFKNQNLNKKHNKQQLKQKLNLKNPKRVKKTRLSLKICVKFDCSSQGPYFKGFKSTRCLVLSIKYLPELLKFCKISPEKTNQKKKNIRKYNFKHFQLLKRPRSKTHEIISLNAREQVS